MMLLNPQPGTRVRIWYRARLREWMPYHNSVGFVLISGRGKPRNHLVQLDDGTMVVVPCGHLVVDNDGSL